MTFQEQIVPIIKRIGTDAAAKRCGVTQRIVQMWIKGDVTPNFATQVGVLRLLGGIPAGGIEGRGSQSMP